MVLTVKADGTKRARERDGTQLVNEVSNDGEAEGRLIEEGHGKWGMSAGRESQWSRDSERSERTDSSDEGTDGWRDKLSDARRRRERGRWRMRRRWCHKEGEESDADGNRSMEWNLSSENFWRNYLTENQWWKMFYRSCISSLKCPSKVYLNSVKSFIPKCDWHWVCEVWNEVFISENYLTYRCLQMAVSGPY